MSILGKDVELRPAESKKSGTDQPESPERIVIRFKLALSEVPASRITAPKGR
jgi:hypothetical protein